MSIYEENEMKMQIFIGLITVTFTFETALADSYEQKNVAGITVHVEKTQTVTTTTTQGRVNVGKIGNSNVFVHGTSKSTKMNTVTNPPEPTRKTTTTNSVGVGIDF
jgi:hypothetical protein